MRPITRSLLALALVLSACSPAKKAAKGAADAASGEAKKEEDQKASDKDKPTQKAPDAAGVKMDPAKKDEDLKAEPKELTNAELLGKLTWYPGLANAGDKMYSGFDGTNKFSVILEAGTYGEFSEDLVISDEQYDAFYDSAEYQQAAIAQKSKLVLTVDPAFVTATPYEEDGRFRYTQLNILKAGSTVIKLKLGTQESSTTLQISAYTPAQIAAGKARYNTAVAGATPSPACKSCHNGSGNAPDHSPLLFAAFSDAGLLQTIETGVNGDDGYTTSITHKWTFNSAAEKASIVPFLRSIDPTTLSVD